MSHRLLHLTLLPGLLLLLAACAGDSPTRENGAEEPLPATTPAVLHFEWYPRVVRVGVTDSARLEVHLDRDGAPLLLIDNQGVSLKRFAPGQYRITLPRATLLRSYAEGDLHAFVGYLLLPSRAEPNGPRYNMFVNVVDGTVPATGITALTADARAGAHVLNIQVPDTASAVIAAVQRLYQLYPDDYDFLAVVQPVQRFQNRGYWAIRNATAGIGIRPHDAGAGFGSAARLLGMVRYPLDGFFDLGEQGATHEIGHRWLVFLRNFTDNGSHWPMSDLARGPMGFAIPGSGGVGGHFPRHVVPQSDGSFRVTCPGERRTFADLELYLMGLLPPDSVGDHYIITGQSNTPACNSTVTATKLTIGDVIAANGPRVPAAGEDRRDFRLATIVLSRGRFLTQDELDFFDHLAARGEARTELHYTSGFAKGTTLPFYLATGGRATLTTRLH